LISEKSAKHLRSAAAPSHERRPRNAQLRPLITPGEQCPRPAPNPPHPPGAGLSFDHRYRVRGGPALAASRNYEHTANRGPPFRPPTAILPPPGTRTIRAARSPKGSMLTRNCPRLSQSARVFCWQPIDAANHRAHRSVSFETDELLRVTARANPKQAQAFRIQVVSK